MLRWIHPEQHRSQGDHIMKRLPRMTTATRRTVVAVAVAAAIITSAFVRSSSAYTSVTSTYTNGLTNMCMGVSGGNMTAGTKVIQWPCIANDQDQLWTHGASPSLWQNAKDPTKCLAIAANSRILGDGTTYNGAGLVIWDCQPSNPGQLFSTAANRAGAMQLWSQLTGSTTAIGIMQGSQGQGTQLDNEHWYNYTYSPQLWEGTIF
jgi:hypothetical protein